VVQRNREASTKPKWEDHARKGDGCRQAGVALDDGGVDLESDEEKEEDEANIGY
jgi:hypothetical protein